MNYTNDLETVAECKRLAALQDWPALIAFSKEVECAKQAQRLTAAEAAYLLTLSPAERAIRARQPVNCAA